MIRTSSWGCVIVASFLLAALLVGPAEGRPAEASPGLASTGRAVTTGEAALGEGTPYPGGVWEPGPPKYGTVLVEGVDVAMDDGVALDASIQYPADLDTGVRAAGPFPVVVEHTSRTPVPSSYFAEHGYISIRVTSRGGGTSGGTPQFFARRDALDGAEIVAWASRLDGSDGRVALQGCSFPAGLALSGAASVGEGSPLKAVVAECMGFDSVQHQGLISSGVPNQTSSFFFRELPHEYFEPIGRELLDGGAPAYDGAFWRDRLPMRYAKKIVDNDVPVLLSTGWQDNLLNGAMRTYAAFQNAAAGRPISAPMEAGQATSPRYQIISGDWGHGGGRDPGIALQWLETWVRGIDTGIRRTDTPMHLFERETDRWVNAATFPAVSRYSNLYLNESGTLRRQPSSKDGVEPLAWASPDSAAGRLSFTSSPFGHGATLAGPMSATIFASSTNTNAMLIAKLFDVAPDGTATEVSKGAVVASLRDLSVTKSWSDKRGNLAWPWQALKADSYLTPNKVYRLHILIDPKQWGVLPGHRLRFDLTTQNPDLACPGPFTQGRGTDPCYLTTPQQATIPDADYTILRGRSHPSRISLPVLPAGHFAEVACQVTPTSREVCLPSDWGQPSPPVNVEPPQLRDQPNSSP